MKIHFVRYEDAPSYFKMDDEFLYAYAKAYDMKVPTVPKTGKGRDAYDR